MAEVCDGVSLDCPPDQFLPSGTVCRASAGECDVEEVCTGGGPDCPPELFLGTDVICRPVAGPCDVEERCPGNSPHCPPDVLQDAGVLCQAGDACRGVAFCTGESTSCPDRVTLADHTPCQGQAGFCCGGFCRQCCGSNDAECDNGNPCTIDTCNGTTCQHRPTCDDGNQCTHNNCDPDNGICTYPNKDDRTACGHVGNVCCDGACMNECCDVSDCGHLVNDCVEVACLGGQCTSFANPDVEGQSCGENSTCRTISNVMRCVECERNSDCPAPANACKRAVCDASFKCVEEIRQFESCGDGATCNATANCVCSQSAVSCSSGRIVGGSCGNGNCSCVASREGNAICTDLTDLQASTTSCDSSRFCEFAGPTFNSLGFCVYNPCRSGYFCAMPCGGLE